MSDAIPETDLQQPLTKDAIVQALIARLLAATKPRTRRKAEQ